MERELYFSWPKSAKVYELKIFNKSVTTKYAVSKLVLGFLSIKMTGFLLISACKIYFSLPLE